MSLPPREIPLGAIRFNSDSQKLEYWMGSAWMQIQTFSPNLDGGVRGVFFGRATPSIGNQIDYITIPTQGDATDFGDMNGNGYTYSTAASSTRGFVAGGAPGHGNMIDFLTFSTTGTVTDTGNLTSSRWLMGGGCSNPTRAIFTGGSGFPSNTVVNTLDYITMASGGDAVDFGDATTGRRMQASVNSATRGIWAGGYSPFDGTNLIDFVTIASTGDAQDFGDLTRAMRESVGVCNATRGIFMGGSPAPTRNVIDYITIASGGNAVSFGFMGHDARSHGSASSPVRGVAAGGLAPGNTDRIDYISISTTGDAVDFGDLSAAGHNVGGTSNGHGGLG